MTITLLPLAKLHLCCEQIESRNHQLKEELRRCVANESLDNVIMLVSARRALELMVEEAYSSLGYQKKPKDSLKGIIDKLQADKQVPSPISLYMLNVNQAGVKGAHPYSPSPADTTLALTSLAEVVEWYVVTFKQWLPHLTVPAHFDYSIFTPQQRFSKIPHAFDPLFVGRETVLQQLETRLQTHHIVALAGFPGMGKTHTSVQFAYLHRHEYQAVLWLSAANVGLIINEFAKLAPVLALSMPADAKDDDKFHAVQQWLASHSTWLLIIDNADEWQNTWQAVAWLSGMAGKVLITTRAKAAKPAEALELAAMLASEAANCLLQRALTTDERATLSEADLAEIQQFCMQTLGGLPLALNQAGAYIEQTGCGLRGYIQRFEQHAMKLLAKPGDAHDPVATTFDLSLAQVEKRKPAAVELLRICAFLDSDQIALEIFLQGAEQLGEPLQGLQQDELELDELIGELLRYSLVKRDETGLSMHRLLQRVVRHQLPQPKEYAERVMNAMDSVFPYPEFENWSACERLLPSAVACCHHIIKYAIATEIAGVLLSKTAYYLQHSKANYVQTLLLYQEALRIVKQLLGKQHFAYAFSLNNLACLYYSQGQYEQALPLFQEALKITGQILGKQHPNYASNLNNLALLYDAQGQYEQALPLFQEVLKIVEQVLGKQHLSYATGLNNLAALYSSQGQHEQALPLFQEALNITGQVLDKQHPNYATSLNNLAYLYDSQGQYEQALPLYQEASEILGKVLGKQHPEYARSLNNLANLYYSQGQYEQALPLFQEALRIFTHALGEQHPDTKSVKRNYEECLNRDS
jgi:tetratricopeptide (TPR) repeat protein